jgi:DNA polymerase III alpha subunit
MVVHLTTQPSGGQVLGLTDHRLLSGTVEFVKACNEAGYWFLRVFGTLTGVRKCPNL